MIKAGNPFLMVVAVGLSGVSALWLTLGLWLTSPSGLSALEAAHWPSLSKPAQSSPQTKPPAPIFASSTGPNAIPEVKLELKGVLKGPKGDAALLSIGGAPASWVNVGVTISGVTLIEVSASKALVDTALGFRTVTLGGDAAGAATTGGRP